MKRLIKRSIFLGLCVALAGCTGRAPSVPTVDRSRERIPVLSEAVARNRSSLDAIVLEIHRLSEREGGSAVTRSRELRRQAVALDSAYRASVGELLLEINAAQAGVSAGTAARYPIAPAPTPFLDGFSDGTNWILRSPLIHPIEKDGSVVVIVPRGFVSDLASIPEPLQILRGRVPNSRRYINASLVHDYLYWRQDCTRAQADNIMLRAMAEAGVPSLERRLVYEGVRGFGQGAWDGNRRARQAGLIRTVAPPDDAIPPTGTWTEYREWLRANRTKEGIEYKVPQAVCRAGDTE